jgi:hypothetical protein
MLSGALQRHASLLLPALNQPFASWVIPDAELNCGQGGEHIAKATAAAP